MLGGAAATLPAPLPPANKNMHVPLTGPRLVDALEFLVGLLHGRHDFIPAGFPWEMYSPGEGAGGSADASAGGEGAKGSAGDKPAGAGEPAGAAAG